MPDPSNRTRLRRFVACLAIAVPLLVAATPASAAPWPGGATVSFADGTNVFGDNLSGLAYQPSGSTTPGVLWAVRNSTPSLFRLLWDGTRWKKDTTHGWQNGKRLRYNDGLGNPDAEGVTLATGDPNGIYVATESNTAVPDTSRPAILRFNITGDATSLSAAEDWDLTGDLPGLGANAGPEAITWVPDDLLVAKGFFDETAAAPYDPADYPGHGRGLFFLGIEQDGRVIAYALNRTTETFTRVASIASGLPKVMALEYEPETTHLWAVCDNLCNGQHNTLDIAQGGPNDGRFVVTNTYDRPTGMANLNNEGFAITPRAECVGGLKPVVWAEDGVTDSHSLRAGTLNCTVPPTCQGLAATITGTSGNDTLTGTAGPDVIAGEGGDDTIKGLGDSDKLCGGTGDDSLSGFDGADTLNGGAGADTLGEGSAGGGADVLIGGSGIDAANYGARAVALSISIDNAANDGAAGEGDNVRTDVENLFGGGAGDTLTTSGSTLANRVFGRGGGDTLNVADGIAGNDLVDGGADLDACTSDLGDTTIACP
jgi:hypothetical protein